MVTTQGWRGGDPRRMLIVPTETVVRVAADRDTTVFVTAGGRLYLGHYTGQDKGTLKQVELGSRCVRDAAVYKGQVVFVTDTGEVFTRALEGDGEVKPLPVLEPKKTCTHGREEAGRRVRVRSVAAGMEHILFLSAHDEIWVQGKGPALGLFTNKTENEITNPARVDFFKGRRVLQVEAGWYFTVALVEALPPATPSQNPEPDPVPDYDSCVRSCSQCRRETGDRVLFQDTDEDEKCPLGLGVRKEYAAPDRNADMLSPAPSSLNLDGRSSRNSALHEDYESSDYIGEDLDPTSGEGSCDATTLNSPTDQGLEMKELVRTHKQSVGSDFEVVDCDQDDCVDRERKDSSGGGNSLFINADAARQFISRQLSWMTTSSDMGEGGPENKYHIDTATELIKENVASAANSAASLVATGVKTVSDKVGQLSRHFSSSEVADGELNDLTPDSDPFTLESLHANTPKSKMSKSDSYECNSLPRRLSDELSRKKTHARTASGGLSFPKLRKDGVLATEKGPEQVEQNVKIIINGGKDILNSEVWAWGASNKGQLGLGDYSHRSTPTSVASLNHAGITKLVSGTHHTAALTIDGQVFIWEMTDDCIEVIEETPQEHKENSLNRSSYWKVFVWGDNTAGQAGPNTHTATTTTTVTSTTPSPNKTLNKSPTPSKTATPTPSPSPNPPILSCITAPKQLALPGGSRARDLAAGENYLVVISLEGTAYYVGKLKDDEDPTVKEIPIGDATTKCRSILSQCDSVVCTTDDLHPQVIKFLKSEAEYLNLLKSVAQHVITPLLNSTSNNTSSNSKTPNKDGSNISNNIEGSSIQVTMKKLLGTYLELVYTVASSLSDALDDQAPDPTSALPIIHQVEEHKIIYQRYISLVCDALAMSGFTPSKEAQAILDKCSTTLYPIVAEDKMRSSNESRNTANYSTESRNADQRSSNELFSYLLLRPMLRVHEYMKFLADVKVDSSCYYSPFTLDKLKVAHTHWKQLSNTAHKNQADAEITKTYWETCSPKLVEALARPGRRLLRESRTNPITVHNAGRFSSHSFVLVTDALVHIQYSSFTLYPLSTMWIEHVPVVSGIQNGISVTLPEDTLTLTCPTSGDKSQWIYALQEGIKRSVLGGHGLGGQSIDILSLPRAPPLVRSASYTFTKHTNYKDATYVGQWLCGELHGEGSLSWPDGRCYKGQFRRSVYHGLGKLEVPASGAGSSGVTIYEGTWRNGKLEGRGIIRYANKDVYSGCLRESQPHGHGELKKGHFSSQAASIYTGEWVNGAKQGYGVLDEIAKGEKYLGMWQNNQRHGQGMVVTMNGIYYEGNFHQNKLTGYGLMMFEDRTYYEGELGAGGMLAGRGILHYPGGDTIEGTFTGSWEDGIKISGILQKAAASHIPPFMHSTMDEETVPKSFGKLSMSADQKWTALLRQCQDQLGITNITKLDADKLRAPQGRWDVIRHQAWKTLASRLETEKQAWMRQGGSSDLLEGLDRIPEESNDLNYQIFLQIESYLNKAFSCPLHPLGQLLQGLMDAFRATYGGVVAHPRLLPYAVQEVRSYTLRLFGMCRVLFPNLPSEGDNVLLETGEETEDIIVTPAFLIHPFLLPHVYSPLSTLYVLHHQHRDEEYWRRLLKWNKQPDVALMTFLGVDAKFWLPASVNLTLSSNQTNNNNNSGNLTRGGLSTAKDQHFTEAIETLQMLSTSFSPTDKLKLIHRTFQLVNKAVVGQLGREHLWSMDDLFPVFQYVVVRSRIQHLGAEIQLIDDLLDPHMQLGELGIMFTTLRACYYQIQNEKPTYIS